MTISKRVLTKWRKEALIVVDTIPKSENKDMIGPGMAREWADRILLLTQELLDQHLLKEVDKDN